MKSAFLVLLFSIGRPFGFPQGIAIDTGVNYLQSTPEMTEDEAESTYKAFEIGLISTRQIDFRKYFYLVFRYRDPYFSDLFFRSARTVENPILKLWACNALKQIGDSRNDAFFREVSANAYSYFGKSGGLPFLENWKTNEKNLYVAETIKASIKTIRADGYKDLFPYLPQYYDSNIRKLRFFYNKYIQYKEGMEKSFMFDKPDISIRKSTSLAYPHQQYLFPIKNSPKKKNFGNKHGKKYHTGEDSGWFLEGLPIHSIGNGIVRKVSHESTWGVFLAIETWLPNGSKVMVYYGHLSENLSVNICDTVYTGQKIGQIGNSVSYENGGYWPHLHLGIEKVAFLNASYLGYDTTLESWSDPTRLLRDSGGSGGKKIKGR